jgi:cytidine deaminase
VITAANVETASYPLTMCAERAAVARALAEGFRRFDAVAVVADSETITTPCGACRQVLWEICGDCWVWLENLSGESRLLRLSELLPLPFDARSL